jgi:hypothetical protein
MSLKKVAIVNYTCEISCVVCLWILERNIPVLSLIFPDRSFTIRWFPQEHNASELLRCTAHKAICFRFTSLNITDVTAVNKRPAV